MALVGDLLRFLFFGVRRDRRRRLPNLDAFYDEHGQLHPIRGSEGYDSYHEEVAGYARKARRAHARQSAADRVVELEIEREHLDRELKHDPRRPLTKLMATRGQMRGHVDLLPFSMVRDVLGLRPESMKSAIVKKGSHKYVKWEYALDEKAEQLGYHGGDALKEAIEDYRRDEAKVDRLDAEIFRLRRRSRSR